MNGGEVDNPEDNGEIVEEEDPSCEVIDEVPNTSQAVVVESNVNTAQEEAPKKSYAAIVSVQFEYIVIITSFTLTLILIRMPILLSFKQMNLKGMLLASAPDMCGLLKSLLMIYIN